MILFDIRKFNKYTESLIAISFLFQDDGTRTYRLGRKVVTIPAKLIQSAIMWSTTPYNNKIEYDFKLVQALLIACVKSDNLALGETQINEATMIFIKGL